MLQLKNIKKDYPAGSNTVHALKGIDLRFRKSEFVSVLGPSGCGKTTMLNIIGGLDQYTEGDLVINGRSTKNFKDRDWDAYRNHSIGFVFQSYNLIPHQSVLTNVELALTLSGVSKAERRARAKKALEAVGLGDQLRKKPGEMSGGQMQRVAIARALVNNPDIILADEPTGALDTETSVQVMEILKEISKDRLIIMVTHNPDLAEKYSTRIINMLDGVITGDSMPLTDEEIAAASAPKEEKKSKKREKKPSMSIFTSFGLSLKNLISKKGRTLLTSFAGSIGIIGIALIYAVSNGMTNYINAVQEETLSSYPLTIEESHTDLTTVMETFMGAAQSTQEHENDAVYSQEVIYNMLEALSNLDMTENDLKSFNEYILSEYKKEGSPLSEAINGIQYTYALDMQVYTENIDGDIVLSDNQALMQEMVGEYFGTDMSSMMGMYESMGETSSMMSMMGTGRQMWQEMLPGLDGELFSPLIEKQYEIVYGDWPKEYNEVVLLVDENNELDDLTLYALGLESKEEIDAIVDAAKNKESLDHELRSWSYEDICGMEFRVVLPSSCYTLDEKSGLYTDLRETQAGLRYLYDNGINLRVAGIIRPAEDSVSSMLTGAVAYTSALTEYVVEQANNADSVVAQLKDENVDIFTGLPFGDESGKLEDSEKESYLREYLSSLDETKKAETYVQIKSIPPADMLKTQVDAQMAQFDRAAMEGTMTAALAEQMGMPADQIASYISQMSDEEMTELFRTSLEERVTAAYAEGVAAQMSAVPAAQLAAALDAESQGFDTAACALYYDEILVFSDSTLEKNLTTLGYIDLEKPATVNLYASSFENKDVIEEAIAIYNEGRDELEQIKYTDYIGILLSSITTIINAITYVLIAFVAISLVVSSIMIGVITLISVQERTKEIGILRAIGASKRNVSSLFNAETVLIGFGAGLVGVGFTWLLCIPINLIIQGLTGIGNLAAELPISVALILIAVSVILTLFSGIIPSRSAAKKDPVVALRTE
ncbi:MAG: ABC transporter ATP-binding protein/permease [Clostridia bacterium]|nr:ABC transporter ATP-binding protein/permease [Clostridia bacterium]